MTGAIAMIEFTPDAQIRLANYLQQVRTALAGSPDINPDEIEADIREHVENELHDAPRPVGWTALDGVLTRLGPPSQWGAGSGDLSLFKRTGYMLRDRLRGARTTLGERLRTARAAIWRGPEDWRLAYLSFGIFTIGAITVFAFPVALFVSYILARAGAASAREKGLEIGARKWLLYPPLVLVSTVLLAAIVMMPVAAGIAAGGTVADAADRVAEFDKPNPYPNSAAPRAVLTWEARESQKERMGRQVQEDRQLLAAIPVAPRWAPAAAGLFVGAGAWAVWWTILGVLGGSFPGAVRAVFFPLAERFRAAHGWWVAVPCAAAAVVWLVAAYEIAASAGVVR